MIWQYILPAVATVTVAVVEALAARDRRRAKLREDRRAEESRLSMQMMSATLQLATVTANALTGGHNNGNVERAKSAAEKAEKDYQSFLISVAAKEVA